MTLQWTFEDFDATMWSADSELFDHYYDIGVLEDGTFLASDQDGPMNGGEAFATLFEAKSYCQSAEMNKVSAVDREIEEVEDEGTDYCSFGG